MNKVAPASQPRQVQYQQRHRDRKHPIDQRVQAIRTHDREVRSPEHSSSKNGQMPTTHTSGAESRVDFPPGSTCATAACPSTSVVELSAVEYRLRCHLAGDPTRVFTKEELPTVWGYRTPSRTIDSHASRLRRKLASPDRRLVIAVWGVGYRLCDPAVDESNAAS